MGTNPEIEIYCKVQGDEKVLCWDGLINSKILLHWFDMNESVNGSTYWEMFKTAMWPKVRAVASRNQYWFQQDCEPLRERSLGMVDKRDVLGGDTKAQDN